MNLPCCRVALLALMALAGAGFQLRASPPPVDVFIRRAAVMAPSLSEDGRHLVYLYADAKNHIGLSGIDLSTMKPFSITLDGDDIYDYQWQTDGSVAFNVAMNWRWARGLYTYRFGDKFAAGINERDLTDIVSVLREDRSRMYVWYVAGGPHRMKGLALVDTDRPKPSGMGHLDDEFMVVRWVPAPPGEILGWKADKTGQVRIGITFHEGKRRVWTHASDHEPWRELPYSWDHASIFGIGFDGKSLYIVDAEEGADTDALRMYDIEAGQVGPVLFRDPDFSLEDAVLLSSRKDESVVGIRYSRDASTTHWFSERFVGYQKVIDAKLPGRVNHIVSWDTEETRLVVATETDRQHRQYFLYTMGSGALSALPPASPWIDPAQMQPMQTVRYKARDGLQLQGYLTLPAKRADGAKPALVVMPHGGPWVRDTWGFDTDVQFLVSRGYAVFQPNYRGSSGFKVQVSGVRSDFRAMYQDVADGTEQVVKSGLVDPQRVGIYGGSFGGFLALAGAAFEPERFKCAVSFAGVFDWAKLVEQTRYKRDNQYIRHVQARDVGDPRSDQDRFDEISPIKHADKIKIPLLLVHGAMDQRVQDEQTKQLIDVLKRNRIKHEALFFKDEGHGFNNPANRAKFLQRLEAFLATHL